MMSIGLQNKGITTIYSQRRCNKCGGTGRVPVSMIASGKIKGLKAMTSVILETECTACNGAGATPSTIRKVIKEKPQLIA